MADNDNFARLNITYGGYNGDLVDPIAYDAADGDIKQWATEAVRNGNVPGIPAQENVSFGDFVVDRFGPTAEIPTGRVMLRPKTPFGVAVGFQGAPWPEEEVSP